MKTSKSYKLAKQDPPKFNAFCLYVRSPSEKTSWRHVCLFSENIGKAEKVGDAPHPT